MRTEDESRALASWMEWLDITGCTCPIEWRRVGRLHGVDMGYGWIRMNTDPACPHHGGRR